MKLTGILVTTLTPHDRDQRYRLKTHNQNPKKILLVIFNVIIFKLRKKKQK